MDTDNTKENGKGIFYGVVGVATLAVAIIGATFAYFSVQAQTNEGDIQGVTEQAGEGAMSLTISKIAPNPALPLIPMNVVDEYPEGNEHNDTEIDMDEVTVQQALTAGCVDENGRGACEVYEATLTTGSAQDVVGSLSFTAGPTNLRYEFVSAQSTEGDGFYNVDKNPFGVNTSLGRAETYTFEQFNLNGPQTFYFVVWLEDTEADQEDDANTQYNGTLTFAGAGAAGGKVTSTFSG